MIDKEFVLQLVLSKLKIVRVVNGVYHCICPNHQDNKPSLHVSIGNIKIILDCKAGCDYKEILGKIGLKPEQLYYDYYDKQKSNRMSRKQYGYEKNCIDKYPYFRIDNGIQTHIKYRMQGKNFPQGYDDSGEWIGTLKDIDTSMSVFCNVSIDKLKQTAKQEKILYYAEGEKDIRTCGKYGLVGFTCGSKGDWMKKKEVFKYVKDALLIIFSDNDMAGITSSQEIKAYYEQLGSRAVVIIPPDVKKGGDISDYMETRTKEDLYKLIDDALNNTVTENRKEVAEQHTDNNKSLIDTLTELNAVQNYETNDKGFGGLFAEVFKDKHRYNPSIKDFMLYDGKKWVEDTEGLSARTDAKLLSDALLQYGSSIGDTDYLKSVTALCNIRNRNNMLQDSKDVYYFSNEQLDTNDYLLNVQNGTLDLSEDIPKFKEHNPDMLLSKICNVEYEPTASCKEWDKFLLEIMQGDKDKIQYLQKIAGLSLTGNTEQETCFILYGSTTRNGKSTFCETLIHLLGDYALTMKPETLAVKQNLDSRQASGDVARLAGCRFCNASEPPKRMLFDTALLKSLLGRDSITARHLHQREFSFIPKFKLVINTNYLPTITDDTVFSSGRINVISFDRHFEPHEQDKHLKDKLRSSSELSGILNWCIEGLRMYRKEGLQPPQAVQNATEVYRTDSDKIGNFINECLVKSDANSKAKDIYEVYSSWCSDNGYGVENKGNFFSELKSKGIFATSGTVAGKTVKNIVKGYVADTNFVEYDSKEQLPFD